MSQQWKAKDAQINIYLAIEKRVIRERNYSTQGREARLFISPRQKQKIRDVIRKKKGTRAKRKEVEI